MKIHHLRSATLIIEFDNYRVLVDPMLSPKAAFIPFTLFRRPPKKNPLVDLPSNAEGLLDTVTHALITHRHPDHLDSWGMRLLRKKQIPTFCAPEDAKFLQKKGIKTEILSKSRSNDFLGGTISLTETQHGRGWVTKLMGDGVGYFIDIPGHSSIYISGDTVLTPKVREVLENYQPDISVVAAGHARMDVGKAILMSKEELVEFIKLSPGKVLANHMDAINHCPIGREEMRSIVQQENLADKVLIPEDGEVVST